MDKKMKRVVLYKPNRPISQQIEERATIEEINTISKKPELQKRKLSEKERSENIYKWLKEHPHVKLNPICKKVKTDRSNFIKGMTKSKELKKELLDKLIEELKQYGYSE